MPAVSAGAPPASCRSCTTPTAPALEASRIGASPRPVVMFGSACECNRKATTSSCPLEAAICRAVLAVPMPSMSALLRMFTSAPSANAASQASMSPEKAERKRSASASSRKVPRALPLFRSFFFLPPFSSASAEGGGAGGHNPSSLASLRRRRKDFLDSGKMTPVGQSLNPSSAKMLGCLGLFLVACTPPIGGGGFSGGGETVPGSPLTPSSRTAASGSSIMSAAAASP
mmetsp:Transcript_9231/g.20605  ORF Transcript_9231/g.20605 Transcript_9231/m.20605 type:complete len:229 (+) Transcript_9231:482-1168(+)